MRINIYFSLYIIRILLYIAILAILFIISYLIYTFLFMIFPKIIMVLLIDDKEPFIGFSFGLILFIIYLIDYDLYNIYYTQTTEKI